MKAEIKKMAKAGQHVKLIILKISFILHNLESSKNVSERYSKNETTNR
jgi:hypothetical protein